MNIKMSEFSHEKNLNESNGKKVQQIYPKPGKSCCSPFALGMEAYGLQTQSITFCYKLLLFCTLAYHLICKEGRSDTLYHDKNHEKNYDNCCHSFLRSLILTLEQNPDSIITNKNI